MFRSSTIRNIARTVQSEGTKDSRQNTQERNEKKVEKVRAESPLFSRVFSPRTFMGKVFIPLPSIFDFDVFLNAQKGGFYG